MKSGLWVPSWRQLGTHSGPGEALCLGSEGGSSHCFYLSAEPNSKTWFSGPLAYPGLRQLSALEPFFQMPFHFTGFSGSMLHRLLSLRMAQATLVLGTWGLKELAGAPAPFCSWLPGGEVCGYQEELGVAAYLAAFSLLFSCFWGIRQYPCRWPQASAHSPSCACFFLFLLRPLGLGF